MLEAHAGDRIRQLDVDRQVIGIELELVAGALGVRGGRARATETGYRPGAPLGGARQGPERADRARGGK
jgi:hypothetical protein